jgi:hypothetical protein
VVDSTLTPVAQNLGKTFILEASTCQWFAFSVFAFSVFAFSAGRDLPMSG